MLFTGVHAQQPAHYIARFLHSFKIEVQQLDIGKEPSEKPFFFPGFSALDS